MTRNFNSIWYQEKQLLDVIADGVVSIKLFVGEHTKLTPANRCLSGSECVVLHCIKS